MTKKLIGVYLFFAITFLFAIVAPSYAISYDLVPPTGTLERGQNITFTINIDTQGTAVTSTQTGLTYDSTLLQYVSTTAGAAMNAVVADTTTYGTGKVLLTGTNTAGYNGTGVFATVVFTIIAQNPGSTEVCTLWMPTPTGTPAPTPTLGPSPTPVPTLPPQPTALPQTGITSSRNTAIILAVSFMVAAAGVFYLSQKQKYSFPDSPEKKHTVKSKVHKK